MTDLILPRNVHPERQYRSSSGVMYQPASNRVGHVSLEILQQLRGQLFDEYALGLCHAFRPISIRVTTGEVTTNSLPSRITVLLDDQERILRISQEACVIFPEGINCGNDLYQHFRERGVDLCPYPAALSAGSRG